MHATYFKNSFFLWGGNINIHFSCFSSLVQSRETAFIHSITSAGVVHAITRSCGKGLIDDCACDPSRSSGGRGRDTLGMFGWGGCSQNIRFATLFARMFVDSTDKNVKDANALMNLHNNRVGRKVCNELDMCKGGCI